MLPKGIDRAPTLSLLLSPLSPAVTTNEEAGSGSRRQGEKEEKGKTRRKEGLPPTAKKHSKAA